jgi:hypothetical protein
MCASMTLEPASAIAFGLPFFHPATSCFPPFPFHLFHSTVRPVPQKKMVTNPEVCNGQSQAVGAQLLLVTGGRDHCLNTFACLSSGNGLIGPQQ